ncbi:MAG: epoxyqueuosine reductase QueH [Treponema sp.]|nr:epoxyqueuosine reductase QueH [Treponema sp.]
MKLLLHSCCAPCSVPCVRAFSEEGVPVALCWYNPNIHPFTEYRSRRDSFVAFAQSQKLPVVMEDEYGLRLFLKTVESRQAEQDGWNRCAFCYQLRLEKTAELAFKNGYDAFSTTLIISPYQDHDLIKEIGENAGGKHGVAFFYRDFRPLFREGQNLARESGYYMQKYCGCIYSEEERYCGRK